MGAKYTEAQARAARKNLEKFDEIKTRAPKGMRDIYKAHAESRGMSLNALVIDLLDKDMEKYNIERE